MKKLIYISLMVSFIFTACENRDREFPDYDYTTVYFAYQSPVRTLVLGEDMYDNTLDNAHKCKIMATMGGVYENNADRILDVAVDNSLTDNLLFNDGSGRHILPMPSNYYSLAGDMQIVIPSGSISGGIEVQLTDAFFADSLSIENTYVIPLRIESVTNADSILSGKSSKSAPKLFDPADWSVEPKNYILYCVKYVNPWHGSYLRRGLDEGKGSSGNTALDTTIVYHNQYVERDQVVKLVTVSMDEVSLSLATRDKGNSNDIPFELRLVFDSAGKCNISASKGAAYTVSGNGELVKDGDMWGNEERDVLHLKYNVDFGTSVHTFTDTLVIRDRGVAFESFDPVLAE
jgi:hypothetical protein